MTTRPRLATALALTLIVCVLLAVGRGDAGAQAAAPDGGTFRESLAGQVGKGLVVYDAQGSRLKLFAGKLTILAADHLVYEMDNAKGFIPYRSVRAFKVAPNGMLFVQLRD